jgi:hypothetical protein
VSDPGQHLAEPQRDAPRNGTGGGRRRAAPDQVQDADALWPERAPNGGDPARGASAPAAEPTAAGDPWLGWTDESPIGRFLAESRRGADELERQDHGPDDRPDAVIPDADPRPANPWSTGSWSAQGWGRPEPSAGWFPSEAGPRAAGPHTAGSGGRRRRAEPDDTPALPLPPDPHLDAPVAELEAESGSWLADAMAELDLALSGRPPASPDAEGCVVVIDLARDGRRFAGRRAGAVVRAVGDQLAGRLPSGARVRHDDADALSVVLPGWNRSAATEWMHGTLPDVFENVVTEELAGTRLRAAVHDIDGPVGAQLLQRLDAGGGRGTAGHWDEPDGRHGSTGRAPSHVEDVGPAGGGGRRRRREDAVAPRAAEPEAAASTGGLGPRDDLASTEGLGLADLLAGALAAYRNI